MKTQRQLKALLDEHGAVLVRRRKHLVYRLPDGRSFTVSATPSDSQRSVKNALANFKRLVRK